MGGFCMGVNVLILIPQIMCISYFSISENATVSNVSLLSYLKQEF